MPNRRHTAHFKAGERQGRGRVGQFYLLSTHSVKFAEPLLIDVAIARAQHDGGCPSITKTSDFTMAPTGT